MFHLGNLIVCHEIRKRSSYEASSAREIGKSSLAVTINTKFTYPPVQLVRGTFKTTEESRIDEKQAPDEFNGSKSATCAMPERFDSATLRKTKFAKSTP